ncbi:MAG: hypothetical protein J6W50_05510 [Bacteroidaceae bacterium]|nr:hypothetical protein [Bacteroidaceae bacterium]MBP5732146.1 hypothetical protein [Bacteroidaceae bacterium]
MKRLATLLLILGGSLLMGSCILWPYDDYYGYYYDAPQYHVVRHRHYREAPPRHHAPAPPRHAPRHRR